MASVAVITRTKNRELLLGRAFESVRAQSCRDLVWVVVNDGGAPGPVEAVATRAREAGLEVVVIHNSSSLGMEAASNKGIRASASEFLVIHDDDDSWQPTFLARTVAFLRSDAGRHYGGVVTRSVQIEEILSEKSCRVWSRMPFNPELCSVGLFSMARVNMFPPISFLYRREYYDQLGGYDESLPVLGDWEFNLRFLLRGDIAVIPELLANYHHRIAPHDPNYGNTIIHGVDRHVAYDTIIRNRLLREDLSDGKQGLGYLVGLSQELGKLHVPRFGLHWFISTRVRGLLGRYFRRLRWLCQCCPKY